MMADQTWSISRDGLIYHVLSDWSTHVGSWTGENPFPVHTIKYEKLVSDPGRILRKVISIMRFELDGDQIERAIEACSIEKLKAQEKAKGFQEAVEGTTFFKGDTDWKTELTEDQVKRIELDHGEMMERMGYDTVTL